MLDLGGGGGGHFYFAAIACTPHPCQQMQASGGKLVTIQAGCHLTSVYTCDWITMQRISCFAVDYHEAPIFDIHPILHSPMEVGDVMHAGLKHSTLHCTHWFSHSHHSIEPDDIGMAELAHDGCLLEELDLVDLRSVWPEYFDSHLQPLVRKVPLCTEHLPKLPSTQRI